MRWVLQVLQVPKVLLAPRTDSLGPVLLAFLEVLLPAALAWVLVKRFNISYHNKEIVLLLLN